MYLIGVRIEFRLLDSYSLKDKRRIVKSIVTRCQSRYKISASEVEDQDMLNLAVIGLALATGQLTVGEHLLEQALRDIEDNQPIEISSIDWEHVKM